MINNIMKLIKGKALAVSKAWAEEVIQIRPKLYTRKVMKIVKRAGKEKNYLINGSRKI